MAHVSAAEIDRLCAEWCKVTSDPGGGLVMGSTSQALRLHRNGVVFHELDYATLSSALCALTTVMQHRSTVIDHDHYLAWAWCGELLLNTDDAQRNRATDGVLELYRACINAALAFASVAGLTREQSRAQWQARMQQPHFGLQYSVTSPLALAYLVFPLLEAALKRACSAYVDADSKVVAPFTVTAADGKVFDYHPQKRKQISSLRDLLLLLHGQVANPALHANVDRIRTVIAAIDPTLDPFDRIYEWRNQTMHGSDNFKLVGGTILTLALLVGLSGIEADFEAKRSTMEERTLAVARRRNFVPIDLYAPLLAPVPG